MLTTVLFVVLGVLLGVIGALKVIAPATATNTDDKVLALLEKVPVEKLLEYVKTRGLKV